MGGIASLFKGIFGGKKWYESLTAWGLVVLVAAEPTLAQMCSLDLLSESACATGTSILENIGVVFTGLGLRKAAN